MSNSEKGLIPVELKEFKNPQNIVVTRYRVAGANRLGRPQTEHININNFNNLEQALQWSATAPEYHHHYEVLLPEYIIGATLNGDWPRETLRVSTTEKVGKSPRDIENHHCVSTDPEKFFDFFDIVIQLETNQTVLFDRGLAWIRVNVDGELTPAKLRFAINAGVHEVEELHEGIIQMLFRVKNVMDDLVKGMPIKHNRF